MAQASYQKGEVLFEDDFTGTLKNWVIEAEDDCQIGIAKGDLVLATSKGVTAWLDRVFEGDVLIEYSVTVPGDGKCARVSDLNMFWMATDLGKSDRHDVYGRNGSFPKYDGLSLYYVGMGGNGNSTTRFRKYQGNGKKPVLQEHTDAAHNLKAGATYLVQCVQFQGRIQYIVDGKVFFDYRDPKPLKAGHFAFRSLNSRKVYHWIKVHRLKPDKPTGLLAQEEVQPAQAQIPLPIDDEAPGAVDLLGREAPNRECREEASGFLKEGLQIRSRP